MGVVITACFYRQTLSSKRIWFAIAMAALLSLAAVSDCLPEEKAIPPTPAQKETAKTPPQTKKTEAPVLAGFASVLSGVTLVGIWEAKTGWRHATNAYEDKELMPEGTVWTLYGLGLPPRRTTSEAPRVEPRYRPDFMSNDPEDFEVEAELPSHNKDGYPLAVSGVDLMDKRPVRVLPPQEDPDTNRLCKYLLENGLVKKVEKIHQVVRADLDGDGKEEHLVTLEGATWVYYAPMDTAGVGGSTSVIAVAHTTDSGTYRVSALTEMAQSVLRGSDFYGAGVVDAEILAIADINGDGWREVAISTNGMDWWKFEVYAFDGNRFHPILRFG
ncbi:MAG: hypothetical protein GTO55_09895 [Armatimonadetes bacterium]|nr:hypothetical protein [Armatimonadota bacterium]NIM24555.1 hypothetical protein [Armatimonadota bacterium]NIM68429.1 hypothetical protein [Armatimonadota bacterium]NIM76815.1 hypothetical protein [Armatimonadota bacterium]NIN06628.1 hypothetical protein [Armatimonadota bacterium]